MNKNEVINEGQPSNPPYGKILAANSGDRKAIAELREELAGPNANALIDVFGDMAYQVVETILAAMFGDETGYKICVREKLRRMRVEFGWRESSALERVLIERIVATWLHLQNAELICNQAKSCPLPQATYYEQRIDWAHRRHLSAVKMLATVRKMALPMQVEIKADINVNDSKRKVGNRFDLMNSNN